ncbi:hypothetical protein GOV04_00215 [Candidatus Woesearchaeota archaeon]|nr:hypothetical protein [Candidatus Woesearchaeota archaeon]
MKKKYEKKVLIFCALALFIILLITLLFFFDPKTVVENLGVRNAYLLTFVISFFGGFSAGGSATFIATLITFAVAGLNPLYLGITAGVALAIGDVIMFIAGSKGRDLIKGKIDKKISKFSKFLKGKVEKFIPFIAYVYIGLTPFPNDLLILSLAAIKYPQKKVYAPIILGDITFALTVTFLAARGITFF